MCLCCWALIALCALLAPVALGWGALALIANWLDRRYFFPKRGP